MSMKEVHEIIREPEQLERFVDWLPELGETECYFLCLQARKKYLPSLRTSDSLAIRQFTSSKQMLISKIRQLECPLGSYVTKEGDIIPDDGLALYITLNPRDTYKATYSGAKALIDLIQKRNNGGIKGLNPQTEILSCIHKSKGKSKFVHFDIDRPTGDDRDQFAPKSDMIPEDVWQTVTPIVGTEAVTIIETRGGCHLLIDPGKVESESKTWYHEVTSRISSDQSGDMMIPVVGCNQGGFTPRFWSKDGD